MGRERRLVRACAKNLSELRTLNLWPLRNLRMCVCIYVYVCMRDAASKKPPSFCQSLSSLDLGRKKRSACEPLLRRAQARQWCFWLRLSCHWPENCKQREVSEQVDSNHYRCAPMQIENRIHCHLQFFKAAPFSNKRRGGGGEGRGRGIGVWCKRVNCGGLLFIPQIFW